MRRDCTGAGHAGPPKEPPTPNSGPRDRRDPRAASDYAAPRHHSRYRTTSATRGTAVSPNAVSSRNLTYARSGSGTNGDRVHQSLGIARVTWRIAVDHRSGRRSTAAEQWNQNAGPGVMPGSPRSGPTPGTVAWRRWSTSPGATAARRGPDRPGRRSKTVQAAPRPEQSFKDLFDTLAAQIERVLRGKRRAVHLSLVCLFSEGHLLIEDVPGVGKTSLAKAIARSTGGSWRRAVHARPAALGHHGRLGVGPSARRLRVPAGRRVRQRRARRRDQPRVAEDAVGAPRVDGGTPGQRRRADVQAATPVHGDRDPEPRRARGHVSRCPKRSSTASCCACASAIPTATRRSRFSMPRERIPSNPTISNPSRMRKPLPRGYTSSDAFTSHRSCRVTSSISPRRPAITAT